MAKDIRFNIKLNVDGRDQVVTASTNVKELANQLGIAHKKTRSFSSSFKSLTGLNVGVMAMSSAIQGLVSQLGEFTRASAVQEQVETQLATAMRNTMGASAEEVQSIKDLCASQQQLGVIGDEVQLAGAQVLATFASQRETLLTLIPALNDMAAGMDGLNVTSSTMESAAKTLGKALQGNVTALERNGVKLTDAQKQTLKLASEQEKAAVLVEVLKARYGDMNAELAKTDAGKMQQMSNAVGDLKERIGGLVGGMMPAIQAAGQMMLAFNGVFMLVTNLRAFGVAVMGLGRQMAGVSVNARIASGAVAMFTRAIGVQTMSVVAGRVAVTALTWALRALEAATVVGAVIAGVSLAVEALGLKSKEAGDAVEQSGQKMSKAAELAAEAQQTYTQQQSAVFGKLMSDYTRLQEEWKRLTDVHSKMEWIARNADAFRQLGLDVRDVVSAEGAFVKNTESVRKAFEMRARFAANQSKLQRLFEQQSEQRQVWREEQKRATESKKHDYKAGDKWDVQGQGVPEEMTRNGWVEQDRANGGWRVTAKGAEHLNSRLFNTQRGLEAGRAADAIQKQIDNVLDEMEADAKESAASINYSTPSPKATPAPRATGGTSKVKAQELTLIADPKTLEDLENNVRYYDQALEKCNVADVKRMASLARLRQEASAEAERVREVAKVMSGEKETRIDYTEQNRESMEWVKALGKAPKTLGDVNDQLRIYEGLLERGDAGMRRFAKTNINRLEATRNAMEQSLLPATEQLRNKHSELSGKAEQVKRDYEIGIIGADEAREQLKAINEQLKGLGLKPIDVQLETKVSGLEKVEAGVKSAWSNVRGLGDGVKSVTEALQGNKDAWSMITSVVDGALRVYDGVKGVVEMIRSLITATTTMGAASAAASAAKVAGSAEEAGASAAVVAANKAETASSIQAAAAGYMAAHAKIPFAGFGIGAGFAGSAAALVKSLGAVTAFANGGVVYGPTLGVFGEYAGASTNPEVVAPLDKLRDMLGGGPAVMVGGELRVRGRDLVAALENTSAIGRMSGRVNHF